MYYQTSTWDDIQQGLLLVPWWLVAAPYRCLGHSARLALFLRPEGAGRIASRVIRTAAARSKRDRRPGQ